MTNHMNYTPETWFWQIGADTSRYWSSTEAAYVENVPDGAGLTYVTTEEELSGVLAEYGLVGPIAIRRRVEKWVIAERIEAAGKSDAAYDLLTMPGNRGAFIKWNMPVESVYFDDADTVAMLAALGLDPEVILAPG
jgi:hypothetical protein